MSKLKTKNTQSSKPKKSRATKETSKTTKAAAPVVETPPEPTPAVSEVPNLTDSFSELLGQLQSLRSQLTHVIGTSRALQKRADKELKQAQKLAKKRRAQKSNRAPSGFVKPTKISKELAAFLQKEPGTEMARTEVTKEINNYIVKHDLQDPSNGRKILADDKLRKLLKLTKKEELTYFNLQKYMSPHFAKKGVLPAESS
jgi:upstream activation factor subunit UAF30